MPLLVRTEYELLAMRILFELLKIEGGMDILTALYMDTIY